jgi:hypothetical protein
LKFGWTLMNNGWLWNLVELWWIMADFEIWLNSVELKGIWLENWNLVGIWLEKLKFGWTLMNNGWLWNLVELCWIERHLTGKIETWTRDAWLWNLVEIWCIEMYLTGKLKFGWNLMYWKVFDWKNWNLVLKLELELPDFEIWLNSDE